jgi:hypothetical protein
MNLPNNVFVVNPYSASAKGTRDKIIKDHAEYAQRQQQRARKQHAEFGQDRDWLCAGVLPSIPVGKPQKRGGMSCLGIIVALVIMIVLALIISSIPV